MNAYEITYIVRPDLDEEQTRGTVEQVTGRLQAAGGEIIAALPWNPPRRRMAYPIRDFGDGFYVTTVFRMDPQALRPVENALKLNERILRYLLVQATDFNIKQAQQRLQQQQAAAAAPRPAPVPAGGAPTLVSATGADESPTPVTSEAVPAPVTSEAIPTTASPEVVPSPEVAQPEPATEPVASVTESAPTTEE